MVAAYTHQDERTAREWRLLRLAAAAVPVMGLYGRWYRDRHLELWSAQSSAISYVSLQDEPRSGGGLVLMLNAMDSAGFDVSTGREGARHFVRVSHGRKTSLVVADTRAEAVLQAFVVCAARRWS